MIEVGEKAWIEMWREIDARRWWGVCVGVGIGILGGVVLLFGSRDLVGGDGSRGMGGRDD